MMQWKSILLIVAIFLLGMVAGCGAGVAYGQNVYNAQLEQKVTDLEKRFNTVNDNYMILVQEYNKLFALRTSGENVTVMAAPTSAVAAPKPTTAPAMVVPTAAAKPTIAPATMAPAAVKPTVPPTAAATTAPKASGGKPKAEFKGLAVGGTGDLEGAPPLLVKFSDLSTGDITSWKWEFGDGQTSIQPNPDHTYQQCPGDKHLCTVKLTVCGSGGCDTVTKPEYIWVSEECGGC